MESFANALNKSVLHEPNLYIENSETPHKSLIVEAL